jgi:16S rRNA (cytosine967-C5)-methyltransferase
LNPPEPRREAYRILRRVDDAGAFASVLLEHRTAGFSDPRDAALLTEIVLGVLRRRACLDHAIARGADRPTAEIDGAVLTALRIGAYALLFLDRVPDFAAVDTAVSLVKEAGWKKAAGFANGALRRVARERHDLLPAPPAPGDVAALALFHSHPEWWTRRLVARAGWEAAEAHLKADNEPAPTVLAPRRGERDLAGSLAGEGVRVEPCRFVPEARRTVSGVPQKTGVFRSGTFWIQDEASQLAVGLLGPAAGPTVLDACAAPGGKTLAVAARVPEGGLVVAVDRSAKRLSRLRQNVHRVRVDAVVTAVADMSRQAPFARAFDDVLVDAPCSGTGTLRRHPEIRWRLTPEDLPVLAERQGKILATAADAVRPGGRLLYSVCSIEPEEGEQVVAAFLAQHPEFSVADPRASLTPAAQELVGADAALRTTPFYDGMDGFYATLLTRSPAGL